MIQEYRKGDIVKMISNNNWLEIINEIELGVKVHLKPIQGDSKDMYVPIEEIENVKITDEIWHNYHQFGLLFTFEDDDVDYAREDLDRKIWTYSDNQLNILYSNRPCFKHNKNLPYIKILLKGCELKGLKGALKDGQYFFLNKLQNYLEDNPNFKEVDISTIPNLINKLKSK